MNTVSDLGMTLGRLPSAFNLQLLSISIRESCGIPDPDNEEIIITGGWPGERTVSVYSEDGWQRDLTSLNTARKSHACGSYVKAGKKVNHILMYHAIRV